MNPSYKVLCIGVNQVPVNRLSKLKYAETDASTVAAYFAALKHEAKVTLLNGKDATKTNILNWVRRCSAIPGELNVIIFFAGHGSAEKDENQKSLERCLWIDSNPQSNREAHQLKTSEILKLLTNPLHQLLFIIDACYNFRQKTDISDIFKQFKESERITSLMRYVIISASAVNRYSFEDPQLKHGVLTYYFLQTIAGKYISFFKKKIQFFRFLATLDKKVRTHRFLTTTGRKLPLKELMRNGIMVHYSDENFQLPLLEPIPLFLEPQKKPFQHKISQWIHFFTCTRLRSKILLMSGLLAIVLLLLYLAQISVVQIHFKPLLYTRFHNSLIGSPGVFLQGIGSERLGQGYNKKINLYLFKHNWINAFLRKLDGKGKIILKGYLLGDRFNGISELLVMGYALSGSEGVFYWNLNEIKRILKMIRWAYWLSNKHQKQNALELLANLGKEGNAAALDIFDFKKETDQKLRDVFLEHFYSDDFWEKNVDYFNFYDYLCLIRNKKQVPFSKNRLLREKIARFLRIVARDLPDSNTSITDTDKLPEIYEKLRILSFFASPLFQKKASDIFKTVFDPDKILDLVLICKNFSDSLWLLEEYFKYMQDSGIPAAHWRKLIYDFVSELPVKEKSKIIKILINTKFQLIPLGFRSELFRIMEVTDPGIIGLRDWENWMKKYQFSPYYVLDAITQMNYSRVFPFIESHYNYFKGQFSVYLFEILYKRDNHNTLQLAKKLYKISTSKDKLNCAIFLYNKNHKEYGPYIVNFLREAGTNKHKQDILRDFYGAETLIPIVETKGISREELRYLLQDREFFPRFVQLNVRLWPEEVERIILESEIPHSEEKGMLLLWACEDLPKAYVYRKKMLVKICKSDIDGGFRLNAESRLIRDYPKEFLKLAYERKYYSHWDKKGYFVQAYQRFSFAELKQELILNLKDLEAGVNINMKVNFICEALAKKEANGDVNIQDLNHILKKFNRPVERILLRKLRHYVHKQKFLRGPAPRRGKLNKKLLLGGLNQWVSSMIGTPGYESLIMMPRPHPETNEIQHKRFAQHIGSPRRGGPWPPEAK